MGNTFLPEDYLSRMQDMLGEDYPAFLASYDEEPSRGIRRNAFKISAEEFERILPFPVRKIPWTENGYTYKEGIYPSRSPLYYAGLYYMQDPSTMAAASLLGVRPGERVLDLCSAPGGKATALGSSLQGEGLLLANDLSVSRCRALLRNLELFGLANMTVTNEDPENLPDSLSESFHKILVDAPCSGEGMFRKEEALARDWSPEKSERLSVLQKKLLLRAERFLAPGGMLLYSTCTFAPCEDEAVVSALLRERSDMHLVPIPGAGLFESGRSAWGDGNPELSRCVRLFPHKGFGEGHFMALFQKDGTAPPPVTCLRTKVLKCSLTAGTRREIEALFQEIGLKTLQGRSIDFSRLALKGSRIYYLPSEEIDLRSVHFLRHGLLVGEQKKGRVEPAPSFALALHKGDFTSFISLPAGDERLMRYLRGESFSAGEGEATVRSGSLLVCAEGYPLGFAKRTGDIVKNKYPAGWRLSN